MLELARQRGGDVDNPNKRDPLDFVLWQPSAPDEPSWDTLWGPGRPGWHIECSALALRELGSTIHLHGGGTDLIFPHHECERAQSEAATGEPFVQHWMHTALISMDGEKMSKSLGNLVFVDALRKEWDPATIRLAHHRSPLPHRVGVGRRADGPVAAQLDAWRAAAVGRRVRARRCSTTCGPGSTTISTRPARSPRSTRRRSPVPVTEWPRPPPCSASSCRRRSSRPLAEFGQCVPQSAKGLRRRDVQTVRRSSDQAQFDCSS